MKLNEEYWDQQWAAQKTGWDVGKPTPPLMSIIDNYSGDLSDKVLIPGCGNAYEAEYLIQKGFTNITLIDISETAVKKLQEKFRNFPQVKVVHQDFFKLTGNFDLILEQTFFCALPPESRSRYVEKMEELLSDGGKLCGVLFNRTFEKQGPPFGGNLKEYQELFKTKFNSIHMEECKNSIPPRLGNELLLIIRK